MELNFDQTRKRAEASFKKQEQARDNAKAMMEYEAEACLVREKTARLRALRLAKEVTEKEAKLTTIPPLLDKASRRSKIKKQITAAV